MQLIVVVVFENGLLCRRRARKSLLDLDSAEHVLYALNGPVRSFYIHVRTSFNTEVYLGGVQKGIRYTKTRKFGLAASMPTTCTITQRFDINCGYSTSIDTSGTTKRPLARLIRTNYYTVVR